MKNKDWEYYEEKMKNKNQSQADPLLKEFRKEADTHSPQYKAPKLFRRRRKKNSLVSEVGKRDKTAGTQNQSQAGVNRHTSSEEVEMVKHSPGTQNQELCGN